MKKNDIGWFSVHKGVLFLRFLMLAERIETLERCGKSDVFFSTIRT